MPWLLGLVVVGVAGYLYKKNATVSTATPSTSAAVATAASTPLDKGLTADQASAVRFALGHEQNSLALAGFSGALGSDFPLASTALAARAKVLGGLAVSAPRVVDMTPAQFTLARARS